MDNGSVRYVGIIGDGPTDRDIVSTLCSHLLPYVSGTQLIILERQTLAPYIAKFRTSFDRATASTSWEERLLGGQLARELKHGIMGVLRAAVADFRSELPRELRPNDLLLMAADSEWALASAERYYEEPRALYLSAIISKAVEAFYYIESVRHNHCVPAIIPLVLFPSTDILVAAARVGRGENIAIHGCNAKELKRSLYGVTTLNAIGQKQFKKLALDVLTDHKAIFQHVPEVRPFLNAVLCASACFNLGSVTSA